MTAACAEARSHLEEHRRGTLPPDLAARVSAHLEACSPCRRLRDEDAALAQQIRALGHTPAPPALRRRVERLLGSPPPRAPWLRHPLVAGALGAAVAALALAPWVRLEPRRPPDPVRALLESGVAEHRRILLQVEATEPVADPRAALQRAGAVARVPVPPVFAGVGNLRLVAARPTLLLDRPSAAAALRYPDSPVTTYFVLPGRDLVVPPEGRVQIEQYRPYLGRVGEFHVVFWTQGELAYLMVTGLDRARAQELFLTMRRAL